MSCSSLLLFSIGREYTLHLASLGKDPNSKCKVRFLLPVCCFHITIKVKKKKSKLSHYGLEAACVPPLRMKFWTLREGMVKRAVTGFELRLPVLRACAPTL